MMTMMRNGIFDADFGTLTWDCNKIIIGLYIYKMRKER